MAGETRLLGEIVKRLKVRQDANRNPTSRMNQKFKNSSKMFDEQIQENPEGAVHTSDMIDKSKTPTQSELQDIRGVPDQEFEDIQSRTRPIVQQFRRGRELRNEQQIPQGNREVAPPNESAPSLEGDPRYKDTKDRLREVMQLRALMKQGKMAQRPGDADIVDRLTTQQKTEFDTLLQELLDEGLR